MVSSRNAGIEDDVQPRELRDRSEDVAAARRAEDERVGQLGVRRQIEPWRREIPRPLDQRFELGLPVARDRDLRAQLLARIAQRFVHEGVARVQLRGELILAERFFVALGAGERPGAKRVFLRRAQLRAFERQPRVVVLGVGAEGLGVFDDGEVVVLGDFRPLAGADAGAGSSGAAGRQGQADAQRAHPRASFSA